MDAATSSTVPCSGARCPSAANSERLLAQNASAGVVTRTRPLCPYPKTAKYLGGDPNLAESFECGGNLDTPENVCMDLVAKFQEETGDALDTDGVPFARSCPAPRGTDQ